MESGQEVMSLDNYFTGNKENLRKWISLPKFEIIRHDITDPIQLEVDRIWYLACPASPIHYQFNPIKTSKTSFLGTYNMLRLARRVGARFLLASTSEIYGDPKISPQTKNYHGYVNPIGIRSCYDEGKRISETLCSDYQRMHNLDIRIASFFYIYGQRMIPYDGRVVSNIIFQSLQNKSLTIYGEGSQTRSFCYVDELINGLIKLMNSKVNSPVNIGNPKDFTILELAKQVKNKINPELELIFKELPKDDPLQRKPNIQKAKKRIGMDSKNRT